MEQLYKGTLVSLKFFRRLRGYSEPCGAFWNTVHFIFTEAFFRNAFTARSPWFKRFPKVLMKNNYIREKNRQG
ncbi:hypothetical protein [Pantoea eucrina]|uniref:hypothetical protein n=1 Tax=Pantoea eucrina TaxID=472693 RepID=UPI002FD989F7